MQEGHCIRNGRWSSRAGLSSSRESSKGRQVPRALVALSLSTRLMLLTPEPRHERAVTGAIASLNLYAWKGQ